MGGASIVGWCNCLLASSQTGFFSAFDSLGVQITLFFSNGVFPFLNLCCQKKIFYFLPIHYILRVFHHSLSGNNGTVILTISNFTQNKLYIINFGKIPKRDISIPQALLYGGTKSFLEYLGNFSRPFDGLGGGKIPNQPAVRFSNTLNGNHLL